MDNGQKTGFVHVERDTIETESDWNTKSLQNAMEKGYRMVVDDLEDKYNVMIDQLIVVNSYTISLRFKAQYRF